MTVGSPPADVLAIGEAMAVFCPDPPTSLRHASRLTMSVAGAEANVAIHLAGLGLRATYLTRVGDDPFGALIRGTLTEAGVDARVEVDPARPTGVYFKNPGPDGTRVHYYRAGSAAAAMNPSVWAGAPEARLVHVSGITPALSDGCAALIDAVLDTDAEVSFDVNHRPGLWSAEAAAEPLRQRANRADIVFVGLDEAHALWGASTAVEVRAILDRPRELVVKDGPVGATAFGPDGTVFVPALPVEVVEPVGAGDAFAAGYLFGLLTDATIRTRLGYGHQLAAAALRTSADVGITVRAADLLEVPDEL